MTIKEAFEKLHKAVKSAGLNPFFLISNLKDTFKDVADNVVDAGGSVVEVESAQESGFLVGNVKVDGEDNYLFAPPQPPTPEPFSSTERLVGVLFHDNISENVYEKTYVNLGRVNNGGYLHFDSSIKGATFCWVHALSISGVNSTKPGSSVGGKVPDIQNTQTVGMALDNNTGSDINILLITMRYVKAS